MNLTPSRVTFTARVAELFQSRPNVWIPGMEIAHVGGIYGWRTRISDCRRPPFNLDIRNRCRRLQRADGLIYVLSEYVFIPEVKTTGEGAADGVSPSPAAV